MPGDYYRPTWVEINLDAIEYNMMQMKQKLGSNTEIMAVVKANGYGHGSIPVAKKAIKSGAKALAVALLEEAINLRQAGIKEPILVLGWVAPQYAPIAAQNDITLTVFQAEWLEEVRNLSLKQELQVHLKIDTGMGRIGIRSERELTYILEELKKSTSIHLIGVYSHFATADASNMDYYNYQAKTFYRYLEILNKKWKQPLIVHIGNSAASIRFPEQMHNFVRFGISMYGLYPSLDVREEDHIQLKPAFSLHSRLVHVKKVASGEAISYGNTYITKESEWIGTVPIGYGDGWIRKLQGAKVLVNGKRMPIVGRICMDQLMIRLDKEYDVGTKVTLIGEQDQECMEMDEIAKLLDTINYEVPCMINERVPRVYLENNEIVSYKFR